MYRVSFEFTLKQKVKITAIEAEGMITGIILEDLGKQYRVSYWHEGGRYSEWLFPEEIVAI